MKNEKKISVVVPVFNEENSLNELYFKIRKGLKDFVFWEIIFIDDGSDDNSFEILKNIGNDDDRVIIVRLYKNYGKSEALSVGFNEVQGDIIITMDSDLQDDPDEIVNLVKKIEEGWDLVSGWKKNRNDPISKKIPSKFYNIITQLFTGLKIHDFNCGIKAYKKKVINSISIYGGLHRYIPALASFKGFSVSEIEVKHHSRKFGKSKYGHKRFFHGFFDFITMLFLNKYFNRPLHFFGLIGIVLFLLGLIICTNLVIGWFNGNWIGNRPIFFLGILFLIVGIQFFSIGLLGELFIKNNSQSEKKVRSIYSSR